MPHRPQPKEGYETFTLEQALELDQQQVKDFHRRYLNASLLTMLGLLNFDQSFTSASGVSVFDAQGNEYLDFLGGYGALNLGHNHPEIVAVLEKVHSRPNLLQTSLNSLAAALAHNLAQLAPGPLQRSFFCNSGTEAVEGALKLARIATGRQKFIYCINSFHGKTFGALSVTGRDKYQSPFRPLMQECAAVPFGDLSALQQQLSSREAAAFIIEPIQGEGGIIEPPPRYLARAKNLCAQYGTLLIADEVQTGFGRTGTFFASEAEDLVPDILCLAKSLGGGLIPAGAYITSEELWRKAYGNMDRALLHTSTFGGNTLACAVALKTIEVLLNQNLCQQAKEKGEYFKSKLNRLKEKYPLLKEVRGRGLMIGLEFQQPNLQNRRFVLTLKKVDQLIQEYMGSLIAGELFNQHRIITAYTLNNPNVIRMEPPLTVTREQLDAVVIALEEILVKHSGFASMAGAGARTVIKKIMK